MIQNNVCDFCSDPASTSYQAAESGRKMKQWRACAVCAQHIVDRDWSLLAHRTSNSMAKIARGLGQTFDRPGAAGIIQIMHKVFRDAVFPVKKDKS